MVFEYCSWVFCSGNEEVFQQIGIASRFNHMLDSFLLSLFTFRNICMWSEISSDFTLLNYMLMPNLILTIPSRSIIDLCRELVSKLTRHGRLRRLLDFSPPLTFEYSPFTVCLLWSFLLQLPFAISSSQTAHSLSSICSASSTRSLQSKEQLNSNPIQHQAYCSYKNTILAK